MEDASVCKPDVELQNMMMSEFTQENSLKHATPTLENCSSERAVALNLSKNVQSAKTRIRKPDLCFFCNQQVQDFARHILRKHSNETEVRRIMKEPKESIQRKQLIASLRKEGN